MLVLAAPACDRRPSGAPGEAKPLTIAVIPKGTTHEFWKSIHAGAARAARELGVKIVWKGPQKEDDRALMRPVRDAAREGIPVVVIDSALQ